MHPTGHRTSQAKARVHWWDGISLEFSVAYCLLCARRPLERHELATFLAVPDSEAGQARLDAALHALVDQQRVHREHDAYVVDSAWAYLCGPAMLFAALKQQLWWQQQRANSSSQSRNRAG